MKRGMDLSDDEQFVEHVASQYTTKGPLGPLVDDMLLDNHHHHHLSSSPMECEHSTYLKKLSNSPALVLNADYKVRPGGINVPKRFVAPKTGAFFSLFLYLLFVFQKSL